MIAPLSLNTPDSDTAPRDPFRLCPTSTIITPKQLTFTSDSDQVRHIPSTKKREADYTGSPAGARLLARNKSLQGKRARALLNGAALVQIARDAHRLGVLQILPNEIILKIIRMLEHNALELHYQRVQDFGLVCLALTSIDVFKICKTVHSAPLPTTQGDSMRDENGNFWAWSLERHVGDFLGPVYEVREPDSRYDM
ncbi:hypothetical protein IFR04_012942 [Cadophora malorum]|uniref:Uncharacterized protein n=1 Tax=Cadophora malorum TaxID=108018 RepID=A0A8H7T7J7_9HELO|nr:hypothetical protein IFR04_012942 [Cadophora malorum]